MNVDLDTLVEIKRWYIDCHKDAKFIAKKMNIPEWKVKSSIPLIEELQKDN